MANIRAVVVLHTLDLTGPLLDRSLTFNSESDRIDIGRASKRENKHLIPDRHNALFDSRVMSRIHAILRVSLEKKLVYIRDPGSMHGTWLNQEKIPLDKDMVLSNGDVLTFGVEVVRGSNTFPPLEVRCECHWLETPYVPHRRGYVQATNPQGSKEVIPEASLPAASNTFCVPDDDDDYDDGECGCASLDHRPAAVDLTTDQSSESNASSVGSDSDDSRSVIEVPSPMTSPLKNNDSKDVRPTDSSAVLAQEVPQSSVKPGNERNGNSEQPLATPRMTPPSVGYESADASGENQYYDEFFVHSSDEDSNVDSCGWEMDGEEEIEEDKEEVQQEEEEEEEEEEKVVEVNALTDPECESFEPDAQVPQESFSRSSRLFEAGDSFNNASQEKRDEYGPSYYGIQTPDLNPLPNKKSSSAGHQQEEQQTHRSSRSAPFAPLYSSLTGYDAQPSLQPNENLSDHYQPSLLPDTNFRPSFMRKPSIPRYSLDITPDSGSFPPMTPYYDGPFAASRQMHHVAAPHAITTQSSAKPDFMPFMDPLAPMIPSTSCDETPNPKTALSPAVNEWKAPDADSELTSPKKRKAAEIESALVENNHSVPDMVFVSSSEAEKLPGDTDLPDAQPQSIAAILNNSDSQLTTVSISESTKETKEDERPSKKVKTSHRGSLRSHAATAILGAVVGAVGTITALASLPPDYFA